MYPINQFDSATFRPTPGHELPVQHTVVFFVQLFDVSFGCSFYIGGIVSDDNLSSFSQHTFGVSKYKKRNEITRTRDIYRRFRLITLSSFGFPSNYFRRGSSSGVLIYDTNFVIKIIHL